MNKARDGGASLWIGFGPSLGLWGCFWGFWGSEGWSGQVMPRNANIGTVEGASVGTNPSWPMRSGQHGQLICCSYTYTYADGELSVLL